MCAPYMPCA